MRRILILWRASVLLAVVCVIGCSSPDERYVELSRESVARQAEQNQQIARQSQQVAEAAHELVQADARARAELLEAQRTLELGVQSERSKLDTERDRLEQDRQELSAAKERESVIANALYSAAILVAVVLPLVLCIYLVRALGTGEPSQDLSELLVYELTTKQPTLLPLLPPADLPRLEQDPAEPSDSPGELQA